MGDTIIIEPQVSTVLVSSVNATVSAEDQVFRVTIASAGTLQLIVPVPPSPGIIVAAVGPQGPPGPPVPGITFVFHQATPSSAWDIIHDLGQYPSVTVVDSAGDVVFGDVQVLSNNEVKVFFTAPFSGTAYLN